MRIAHITRMLPRVDYAGGVSGQVDLLARALVARGHDVAVFAVNSAPDRAAYAFRAVELPWIGRRWPQIAPFLFPWCVARLPLDDFDVVHCHGDDHLLRTTRPRVRTFYGSSWGEVRSARRLRHRVYHLSMALTESLSARRAAVLGIISTSTQRYLRRRALVIPCAYDDARFFAGGPKSDRPSILFVGDLDTRKRGRLLLQVFVETIKPAVPDAELWVVSVDRPPGRGVHSMGRLTGSQLADLYRRAWVFCLPSAYEGFGVPYVEAMASGTPVVATPNGGSDEVLDGGRYGRLVPEHHLGACLVQVLQSRELRNQLIVSGLERAKKYTAGRMAERYEALYLSLGADHAVPDPAADTFDGLVRILQK
jgi:glycosyltransferase involved in cell wall biosynthesis